MKSSLFQFYFSDMRSTGAAEEIDEKKNLKKFYVRHCRLQVTCTVFKRKGTKKPKLYCMTFYNPRNYMKLRGTICYLKLGF